MTLTSSVTKDFIQDKKSIPSFLNYANKCRNQKIFNNVTIKAQNKIVSANQLVLSCYCPFFEKIFKTATKKEFKTPIELEGVSGKVLNTLIDYIYSGRIWITTDNVLDILAGVDYLQLVEAKKFCFEFLEKNISTNTCLLSFKAALKYDYKNLKNKFSQRISNNFNEISSQTDFQELSFFELSSLIYNLDRDLVDKAFLRKSITNWATHDEKVRSEKLLMLMWFVDLKEISFQFLKSAFSEKYISEHPDSSRFITKELPILMNKVGTIGRETRIISIGGGSTANQIHEIYYGNGIKETCCSFLPVSLHSHASLYYKSYIYCIGGYCSDRPTPTVLKGKLNGKRITWEQIAPLNFAKVNMGATVFKDVLVISGGENFCRFLGAYASGIAFGSNFYDDVTDSWADMSLSIQNRCGNELVVCRDCLYSLGGKNFFSGVLKSVERLKSLHGKWEEVSPMQTPRSFFAAVSLNDFIYVFGGEVSHCNVLKSVERYDPAKDQWDKISDMTFERRHHRACVFQGKIFAIGGYNAEFYGVKEIECYYPFIDKFEIVGTTKLDLYDNSILAL